MHYQGRSPLKDVARSVVMGAAMVSPALLQACSSGQTTSGTTPDGNGTTTGGELGTTTGGVADTSTGSTIPATATAAPTESAPPDELVRPRGPTGGSMPTRGFQGASSRGAGRARS